VLRRSGPLAAIAALVLLLAPAGALACEAADAEPGAAGPAALEAATVCLINAERAAHGIGPLAPQADLHAAAAGHAADMVARRYFDHQSPEGGSLTDRVRAAGWLPSAGTWRTGENIAWGTGTLATPRSTVSAWMNSAGHRATILEARYDEIGLALASGNPRSSGGATYVADFGTRELASDRAAAPAPAPATPPARPAPPAPAAGDAAPGGSSTRGRTRRATPAQRRAARRAAAHRRCIARARRARARGRQVGRRCATTPRAPRPTRR
jgi:uncharacterized protein YkwD